MNLEHGPLTGLQEEPRLRRVARLTRGRRNLRNGSLETRIGDGVNGVGGSDRRLGRRLTQDLASAFLLAQRNVDQGPVAGQNGGTAFQAAQDLSGLLGLTHLRVETRRSDVFVHDAERTVVRQQILGKSLLKLPLLFKDAAQPVVGPRKLWIEADSFEQGLLCAIVL